MEWGGVKLRGQGSSEAIESSVYSRVRVSRDAPEQFVHEGGHLRVGRVAHRHQSELVGVRDHVLRRARTRLPVSATERERLSIMGSCYNYGY